MKILKRIFGFITTILVLNVLFTWIFIRKNPGEDYIKQSEQVKVHVDGSAQHEKFSNDSFLNILFFSKEFTEKYGGTPLGILYPESILISSGSINTELCSGTLKPTGSIMKTYLYW